MDQAFWQLQELSDEQLLCGLARLGDRGRRVTAELVAHLAEVEHRRLHLHAACSSLFEYCVTRLGLSEDEACRRIEAARLGRRFPELFPLLAEGELSLSVAALLKPYLSEANHRELFQLLAGRSVRQARERLAARFPRPDVRSSVRKLPVGRSAGRIESVPGAACQRVAGSEAAVPGVGTRFQLEAPSAGAAAVHGKTRIEPLSAERYRVQFTAGVSLKQKLELSRDLMLHQNPSGELAPIVEQALDLLLERLMQRRFGRKARASRAPNLIASGTTRQAATPSSSVSPMEKAEARQPAPSRGSARIGNATRRIVSQRDGLCCTWVDPSGKRCASRAWLEFDHRVPRGKAGGSAVENVRLLCRAHNRLSAELHYGRAHVERAIAARKSTPTAPSCE